MSLTGEWRSPCRGRERNRFFLGRIVADDTPGYSAGASEHTIGRALEGRRDKVVIASKFVAGADETRASLMRALETSLRRLRTDYIDVYFNLA